MRRINNLNIKMKSIKYYKKLKTSLKEYVEIIWKNQKKIKIKIKIKK